MEGNAETSVITVNITLPVSMDPSNIEYIKIKDVDKPAGQEIPFQVHQVRNFSIWTFTYLRTNAHKDQLRFRNQ